MRDASDTRKTKVFTADVNVNAWLLTALADAPNRPLPEATSSQVGHAFP